MNTSRLFRTAVLLALLVSVSTFLACSKKKSTSGSTTTDKFELSGELLGRLPSTTTSFFRWDSTHKAYQKLLQSPWAGTGDFMSLATKAQQSKSGGRIEAAFKKAGLSLDDETALQRVFAKGVLFAAPASDGTSKQPELGVMFRSDKSFDVPKSLDVLSEELKKEGLSVVPSAANGIKGMSFDLPCDASKPNCEPLKVFVGTKDGLTVLANQAEVVNQVHGRDGKARPGILDSPRLKRVAEGLPGNSSRFAFGFVDVVTLLQQSEEFKKQLNNPEFGSLEAVALSFAMNDTPESDVRVLLDEKSSTSLQAVGSKTPGGSQLYASISQKPIIFLSFDATVLRALRDLSIASKKAGADQFAKQLSFLDDVGRVGIMATLATPGTSFLPIPNFMLMVESSKPEVVNQQLRGFVSALMSGSGMGTASGWTEKDLEGTKGHSMQGTLGIGAHIASGPGLVLLTTSEQQLKQGLKGANPVFLGGLQGPAKQVFESRPTVGNFYLDFDQVASFMETMGGVLSLYAPQDKSAAEFLKPENIASLRKMGAMIGSVEQQKDMIALKSFYQPGAVPK